jgi:translocation and assembly module TamA
VTSPGRTRADLLLAIALLAGSACFLKQPPGTPERPLVVDFDIEGTQAISASDLRDHLVTQPSTHRLLVIPEPSYFDEDAFANDKRRILEYYRERGYYRTEIESAEVIPEGPARVKLHVRIKEGPPVHVVEVNVLGLEGAPDAKARLERLPLEKGDVFTIAEYDATRSLIQDALMDTGWAHAEVTQHAQIDPNLDEARVTYEATPGERYKFGSVFVAGAAAIPRARIREEAEAFAKPGTTFDASDLSRVQARVFDLGVFGGVRVSPGPADEEHKTIPTVVSVREAPFRTVRAGPEFSVQATTRWEADLMAGWSHRNWLGGLRKLNLDARAGYAWLPTLIDPQTNGFVGLASADFTQPEFFSRYLDLNVHGELERGRELAYTYYAERARLGVPFRLGRLLQFVPSINFELYQLQGDVGASTDQGQLQLATCPGQNPNRCLLSYLEQRIGVDLRDDPINTTQGAYFGISLQEGFSLGDLGATYLRVLPEARAFVNLHHGVVAAGRLRIGLIQQPSGTSVPIVALFTSGGPNFMRGYYTRKLAPSWLACPAGEGNPDGSCKVDREYFPIGGAGLIDGGLELRFPIVGQLGGAAFMDFGNVTFHVEDVLDVGKLQYAPGVGLRYKTPFGPVRLDLAYRLPINDGVESLALPQGARAFTLQDGVTHQESVWAIHLSIGEAF